jgi:RNA polymerase sigma factor (sigma-70 family)
MERRSRKILYPDEIYGRTPSTEEWGQILDEFEIMREPGVFGVRVRDFLATSSMSLRALADDLGVHPTTMSQLVTGRRRPTASVLLGAASYFTRPRPIEPAIVPVTEAVISREHTPPEEPVTPPVEDTEKLLPIAVYSRQTEPFRSEKSGGARPPLFDEVGLARLKEGDEVLWSQVVRTLTPALLSVVGRQLVRRYGDIDLEDVVQKTWIALYRYREKIRPEMTISYLFAIAQRLIYSYIAEKRQEEAKNQQMKSKLHSQVDIPVEDRVIEKLIYKTLPLEEQIERDLQEGYTVEEIAERKEIFIGRVYSLVANIKNGRNTESREANVLQASHPDLQEENQIIEQISSLTRNEALQYFYSSQGLTQAAFCRKAGFFKEIMTKAKRGGSVTFKNVDKMIEASPLIKFGLVGKPAQVMRLKLYEMDPMTLNKLNTCTFSELAKYLRILRGRRQSDIPGIVQTMVSYIEKGSQISAINWKIVDRYVQLLELPEGTALEDILRYKAEHLTKEIPKDVLLQVLQEPYYFTNSPREIAQE